MPPRVIAHVDMDAFFASVEQLDHPELRGKPVLVGGSPEGRGVVCAASYEARRFGCRGAMPAGQALRLCPQAIVLPVRHARYRQVSTEVFEILQRFSPLVEPVSIDEAYLDLTGTEGVIGAPEAAARALKAAVRTEIGLTASVGIGPVKVVAKLASDYAKPDGLTIVPEEEAARFLGAMPLGKIPGIGPATEAKFRSAGASTVAGALALSEARWLQAFGDRAPEYRRFLSGDDPRPVRTEREVRSISHETTFPVDCGSLDHLEGILLHLVEDVAYRLRRRRMFARRIGLKLRRADFRTVTRGTTMPEPECRTREIWLAARGLLRQWWSESGEPLRLIGIGAAELLTEAQRRPTLFEEEAARERRLDTALDDLRDRFGADAIRRRPTGR